MPVHVITGFQVDVYAAVGVPTNKEITAKSDWLSNKLPYILLIWNFHVNTFALGCKSFVYKFVLFQLPTFIKCHDQSYDKWWNVLFTSCKLLAVMFVFLTLNYANFQTYFLFNEEVLSSIFGKRHSPTILYTMQANIFCHAHFIFNKESFYY